MTFWADCNTDVKQSGTVWDKKKTKNSSFDKKQTKLFEHSLPHSWNFKKLNFTGETNSSLNDLDNNPYQRLHS